MAGSPGATRGAIGGCTDAITSLEGDVGGNGTEGFIGAKADLMGEVDIVRG